MGHIRLPLKVQCVIWSFAVQKNAVDGGGLRKVEPCRRQIPWTERGLWSERGSRLPSWIYRSVTATEKLNRYAQRFRRERSVLFFGRIRRVGHGERDEFAVSRTALAQHLRCARSHGGRIQ